MARPGTATPADVRAAIGGDQLAQLEEFLSRGKEDPLSDELLARLLMIRQNNVQQVKEVIIAWATWRAEHAIGWIPYDEVAPILQGNALAFLQGNSRQGHPLVILRVGILSTLADGDSMLKVIMYVLDIALSSADTALNPSRRVCMLLDMQGVQRGSAAPIMRSIINMTKDHYPGRMERVCIHGAPTYVWATWSVIAQLLPPFAREVVKFTSQSNILSHLTQLYDAEVLVEYQGTGALQPLAPPTM